MIFAKKLLIKLNEMVMKSLPAKILKMLEHDGLLDGKVQQSVFVDGGSAMKVYAVDSDGTDSCLDLLNRVAAGSRNGPGADPDGLNLYTLLKLNL